MAHARVFWRKTKQKVKVYYIDYEDANGIRHREAAGPVKEVADLRLRDALLRAAKGELKLVAKPTITLDGIAERYLRHKTANGLKAIEFFTTCLNTLRASLGKVPLHEITPGMLDDYIAARVEGKAPLANGQEPRPVARSTVNRDLAVLRNLLTLAGEWGCRVPEANPARKKQAKEPRGRLRFLTEAEAERLLAQCTGRRAYLRPIIECALQTGMRQGEILGLTWDRLDFAARQIALEDTKNGRPRYVPVNERLYYLLRRLAPTPAAGPVFVGRRGHGLVEIKKGYVAAVKAAKLEDVTFHTLRHTAASWMVQRGVDLYRVKEILGHATIAMTERYAHLAKNHLADAVAVLACAPGHTWGTMAEEVNVSP